MTRDRFTTRAAILDSAAAMIASHGLAALGVNSLAHAANCDKVLIYRYFGGLDGVLASLGAERTLWPRFEIAEDGESIALADAVHSLLLEEWAALADNALMREAAAAELSSDANPLGSASASQRAEHHARLIATLRDKHRIPPYIDLPALIELLSAALSLFALRAAPRPTPPDAPALPPFDITTPQGWRRIEKILASVTRALLSAENG